MKTLISTFLSLCVLISVSGQKRTVDANNFSKLSLGIPATVYLKQGSSNEVVVECDEDVFEEIEFEMRGDRLAIRKEGKGWNWSSGWRSSEVDIYVTMESIEALSVSGSGNIESKGTLETNDLELVVSGSGDMYLNIDGDDLDTRISGSGSIRLKGMADDASSRISGSGKVKAEELTVKSFEARISGSGSCYITVEEEIEASISGSGNVYYAGNPDRVISNASGSGKIKKL